jgi:hypothetical protein
MKTEHPHRTLLTACTVTSDNTQPVGAITYFNPLACHIQSSVITQSSGNIAIGTSTTPANLQVNGAATVIGTSTPLLAVTDGPSAPTSSGYLGIFQGAQSSTNTPLEIASQAASSTGFAAPPALMSGYLGVDLIQLAGAGGGNTYASPYWRMCSQSVLSSGANTPLCWMAQVLGGSAPTGTNPASTLEWTMSGLPANSNFTMLWPAAVNLAAHGQITVGPMPTPAANAYVPSTFTGQDTTSTSALTAAGPITVEPGQLTGSAVMAGATEGPLQVLQAYLGTNNSGNNIGLLACPSGTAQNVIPCGTTGQAENWVGVYNSIPNQNGINGSTSPSVTPLRYGRVLINSQAMNQQVQWTSGDFVCKDDSSMGAGYAIDNSIANSHVNTPCPIGESVGVAVGDPAMTTTPHLVDLIPEASVSGAASQGQVLQFTCFGPVAAGTTVYLNGQACNAVMDITEFNLPYQSGAYMLKNLYGSYGGTPTATDSLTLWVNTSATSVTCNPSASGTAPCPDITHNTMISPSTRKYSVRLATSSGSTIANLCLTIQLQ